MQDIKVLIPHERITEKVIKGKDGEFKVYGVLLADKFVRLVMPRDTILPENEIEGNLYGRKYKTKFGDFSEVAIYVQNPVKSSEADKVETEEELPL